MISQNRADAKREVLANQQWKTVEDESEQNQELLALSHQGLDLTKAVHSSVALARTTRYRRQARHPKVPRDGA
jgi:hypothetical protein